MTYFLIFISIIFEISLFYFLLPKLGLLKACITILVGNIVACMVASILLKKVLIGWQHIFDLYYESEYFNYFVAIIVCSQAIVEYVLLKFIFKQSSVQAIIVIALSLVTVYMLFLGFQDPSLLPLGKESLVVPVF